MSQDGEPEWRRTPAAVFFLIGLMLAAYLRFSMLNGAQQNDVFYYAAVIPARFDAAGPYHFTEWYQPLGPLLGHVFLHGGWLHLGMNIFVFIQAGPFVAMRLGPWRFLTLFFLSAAGGALAFVLVNPHAQTPMVGASGAICGVFGAYFLSVRRSWREALADQQVRNAMLMFLFVNVFLAGVASVSGFLPIAWEAHLGGFVAGALLYLALARRIAPGPWG